MKRRNFLKMATAGCVATGTLSAAFGAARATNRPNVLFIPVDDLRPDLGCFGHPLAQTPSIDRLAAEGMRFSRAYCQQAVCAPSRMSLLSGCRPDTLGVYGLDTLLRDALPDVLSLPEHFRKQGYTTVRLGKVYHLAEDDPQGWSSQPVTGGVEYCLPETTTYVARRAAEATEKGLEGINEYFYSRGPACESADVSDAAYEDGAMTETALDQLRELAKQKTPFFLATGFHKPHLPFCAPKRYWDMYDPAEIPLPDGAPPVGAASVAFTDWTELRAYSDIPDAGLLSPEQTRHLIHGYLASTSFIDEQVGRLLDELDRLGLRSNTVVVLWGDHGWKLGEYGSWCKHTNFEYDTNAPLIISAPNLPKGEACTQPVEFLDVYPTLAEVCGLPVPAHCEGQSLLPLLRDADAPWRDIAVSQYPRRPRGMGYTLRHKQWRYVEWKELTKDGLRTTERELYDHSAGPRAQANLINDPQHATLVETLSRRLQPYIRINPALVRKRYGSTPPAPTAAP